MDVFISEEYVTKRQEIKKMKQQQQQQLQALLIAQTETRRSGDFVFNKSQKAAAVVNSPTVDSPDSPSDSLFSCFSP